MVSDEIIIKKKIVIYLYPLMLYQTLVTVLHGNEKECLFFMQFQLDQSELELSEL